MRLAFIVYRFSFMVCVFIVKAFLRLWFRRLSFIVVVFAFIFLKTCHLDLMCVWLIMCVWILFRLEVGGNPVSQRLYAAIIQSDSFDVEVIQCINTKKILAKKTCFSVQHREMWCSMCYKINLSVEFQFRLVEIVIVIIQN